MQVVNKPVLKHRHILTSNGNLRLRYVAITAIAILAGLWGGMTSYTSDGNAYVSTAQIAAQTIPSKLLSDDPEQAGRGLDPYYAVLGTKPEFNKPYAWTKTIEVASGDTLGLLMEKTPLTGDAYMAGMKGLKQHVDPRDIKPGQKIEVQYITQDNVDEWSSINYRIDGLNMVSLQKDAHGDIIVDKQERDVELKTHAARAVVSNSLFYDLSKAGVPDGVVNKLIHAYSWSVDFQRDIWGGETIEVLYETKETADGSYVRSGRLLYANLGLRGNEMPIYLFEKEKGYETYFEPNGQSIKKALLKTPVNGARLSSGYGKRRHPVLGYTKMHKGVDFAAPTGTPIFAAGDGVVERANRFSSFGNYIKIRHNNNYHTAYAHLHGFAKGVRAGTRVKQGQVIGYIGSTGRSTGPHLHYEIHKNGRAVNPNNAKLPIGEKLKGAKLAEFKRTMGATKQQFATAIRNSTSFAALDKADDTSDEASATN
jgi:murein DD-endopeptidase MepM/ murein hydrolase activator NlpD